MDRWIDMLTDCDWLIQLCIYICKFMYTYVYIYVVFMSLSVHTYTYIYMLTYMCICIGADIVTRPTGQQPLRMAFLDADDSGEVSWQEFVRGICSSQFAVLFPEITLEALVDLPSSLRYYDTERWQSFQDFSGESSIFINLL